MPFVVASVLKRDAVDVARDDMNYGSYLPNLPACVARAETKLVLCALTSETIEFNVVALTNDG